MQSQPADPSHARHHVAQGAAVALVAALVLTLTALLLAAPARSAATPPPLHLVASPAPLAAARPLADARAMQLRSCVAGSPPLEVAVSAERATLDARDRLRFQDAAQARYPLYQRGGLSPTQVLMLRRGGQWQYVTLREDGRGGPCFTAVFAAERFDFTPGWLAKYQPHAGEADD